MNKKLLKSWSMVALLVGFLPFWWPSGCPFYPEEIYSTKATQPAPAAVLAASTFIAR